MLHARTRDTIALMGLLSLTFMALAQPGGVKQDSPFGNEESPTFTDAVSLPTDRDAKRQLEAARDYIKKENWEVVTDSLQRLLEIPEDSFLEVERAGPDGSKRTGRVSVRAEANRLIGNLSKEGREFYQLTYGRAADARLKEGIEASDVQIIAEVSQRYFHTQAGAKATAWLASYHLDRGRPLMASLCYERLLARPDADQLDARALFQASLALKRAGNDAAAERVWKQFRDGPGRNGLRVGRRTLDREQLRAELDRPGEAVRMGLADWAMFRGSPARTAQGIGGAPFLDPRWTLEMLPPESKVTAEPFGPALLPLDDQEAAQLAEKNKPANDWVRSALKESRTDLAGKQPILPTFFPVAAADKLIYRAHDGVYAARLKDDPSGLLKAGQIEWMSAARYGLHTLVEQPGDRNQIDSTWWKQGYLQTGPKDVLFTNSLIGSLSHDGRRVYFVDDLALPPPPQLLMQMQFGGNAPQIPGSFSHALTQNILNAVDLETGKLVWDFGNLHDVPIPKEVAQTLRKDHPAADAMFLGPPLPVAGKLYVMVEKNAELTLLCLDPNKPDPATQNLRWPTVVWKQQLGTANHPLPQDSMRRLQAVQLAYGDGILVCPTNAGAILGVDLLTHSLVWAHSYRTPSAQAAEMPPNPRQRIIIGGGRINRLSPYQNINTTDRWRPSAPAIADGKVVFTAHDMTEIHCLDLRDGSQLIWRASRASDDLFLAGVFGGHVVVVGKSHMRGLKLADGSESWRTSTGLPSGQGVASGDVYYLPLASATETREPEVCAIDVKTGRVVAHTRSRKKEVPGNLVFYEGSVFSQSDLRVTAYPQLKLKLEEIDRRLAARPNDPVGLTERAELRLDKGDTLAAVGDLRTALEVTGIGEDLRRRARLKLYEALTDLLQQNFPAGESYLTLYRELCSEPGGDEAKRRLSNYMCLLARGREKQGQLIEAFQAYVDFVNLHGDNNLVPVIDEPSAMARPDVWARGRILAMIQSAKPTDRQPLEARVAAEWQTVKSSDDLKRMRDFVTVFGVLGGAGTEARLALAERLIEAGSDDEFVEAENHLLQLRNAPTASIAAKATEALARLMARKGLFESAVAYYRDLARNYPKELVRDGKTGAELLDELVTDKRFLPYLEPDQGVWSGRFRADQKAGTAGRQQASFTFEPEGDASAFFRRHRLVMDVNPQQNNGRLWTLRIVDRASDADYWKVHNLPANFYLTNTQYAHLKFAYVRGHLLYLTMNEWVYAFDVLGRRKLWQYNLLGESPIGNRNQVVVNQIVEADGGLRLIYQDGWTQKLGQVSVIEDGYVCLYTRDGLVTLDPISGEVLWKRSDVSSRLHLFGDAQYVYMVESNDRGEPTTTRVLQARDGATAAVPDFTELLSGGRVYRLMAGQVLVFEDHEDRKRLRLHDIPTGETVWQESYRSGTKPIRCDDTDFTGVIEPDGRVVVVQLSSRKVVLDVKIDNHQLPLATAGILLLDRDRYYITLAKPVTPGVSLSPCVGTGIRTQALAGSLWAFDRSTGQLAWADDDLNEQFLIQERFEELPVVLCAVTYHRRQNNGATRHGVRVTCVDKRTGKLILEKDVTPNGHFTSLHADPAAGLIELVRHDLKLCFTAEPERSPRADARP